MLFSSPLFPPARSLLHHAVSTLLTLCVAIPGCRPQAPQPGEDRAVERTELAIYAASSLTEAFGELADSFQREHPTTRVHLHFAGSHILRAQIENGAPADIFASADRSHIQSLQTQQLVDAPKLFAHNDLTIVTPPANPASLYSVLDLPRATRLVIGTPSVPIGRYTDEFLRRASSSFGADYRQQVEHAIVSREANTRLVLAKIILQEADAGIVYRSDAFARRESINMIPIPESLNPRADYMIAVLRRNPARKHAAAWVDFVRSTAGQQILERHGFTPLAPSPTP